MKLFAKTLRVSACVLLCAAAFAYIIIEGSQLFSGYFLLCDMPASELVRLTVRTLFSVIAFVAGIASLKTKHRIFFTVGLCITAASLAALPFTSNGLGFVFTFIAALYTVTRTAAFE